MQSTWTVVEEFVAAFESAWNRAGAADLFAFLPPRDHPRYLPIVRELIRVDLEWCWEKGCPRQLAEYQTAFPEVFEDPEAAAEISYEEDRLRRQAASRVRGPAPLSPRGRGLGGEGFDAPDPRSSKATPELNLGPGQAGRTGKAFESWYNSVQGDPGMTRVLLDLQEADPKVASRLAEVMTGLPEVGSTFLGFHLLKELGQGAFGKVFLAQQGDLANRFVALKVSTDLFGESQTLAQLQHTNVVPIYSLHQIGSLQAVCMAYFGASTLADVLRHLESCPSLPESGEALVRTVNHGSTVVERGSKIDDRKSSGAWRAASGAKNGNVQSSLTTCHAPLPPPACTRTLENLQHLSYVEAVLWLGARVAAGLAHAHERGILHRDLKPANILLTDEGQPMLLDFNLSEDTKQASPVAAARIGGTLPYMAPEHMEAFRGTGKQPVDARSDLYSLGIILFELLTGRHPFPKYKGSLDVNLPRMIADRSQPPPDVRTWNCKATPAVASIVRHCLEPALERRYASAQELHDDLERQLERRPLKHAPDHSLSERTSKWVGRHPRLATATLVAMVLIPLLLGPAVWYLNREQQRNRDAREGRAWFTEQLAAVEPLWNPRQLDAVRLNEKIGSAQKLVDRYQVLSNPEWQTLPAVRYLPTGEQQRLGEDAQEVLLLLAQAKRVAALMEPDETRRHEGLEQALDLNLRAETCVKGAAVGPGLWLQRAELAEALALKDDARRARDKAQQATPTTARDFFLLGFQYVERNQHKKALELLQKATEINPKHSLAWHLQGLCHNALGDLVGALTCCNCCIALWPDSHLYRWQRGLIRLHQKNYPAALRDFDEAIRLRPDVADVYLDRSLTLTALKDDRAAIEDLTAALQLPACPSRVWFLRSQAWARLGEHEKARNDLDAGLRTRPADEISWISRGLAQLPKDPHKALADFDEALRLRPDSRPGLQNKAHVLSDHLHRTEEALAVSTRVVQLYPDFVAGRLGRGVLLARLGKRDEALKEALECLQREGNSAATAYQTANIYALTSQQVPQDRETAYVLLAVALQHGFGLDIVESDSDFDPIRKQPEFRKTIEAARFLRAASRPRAESRQPSGNQGGPSQR